MAKRYRHEYIIGDLQGCYASFLALLAHIGFDERQDKLWLAGDIVARGEDSLSTLRYVKALSDKGALTTVLGNHDITLIATWLGVLPIKPKDKTAAIFSAPDCDALMNWLRRQPLLVLPSDDTVLVHAGIPPNWRIKDARRYAREVEVQLAGSRGQLKRLLPNLYSKKSERWHEKVHGYTRLRLITDYFTRMRLCDKDGLLEFGFKASLSDTMPTGFRPWFEWQVKRRRRVFFGHWAALKADVDLPQARALDGGCVWGGRLVAYRLGDGRVFDVGLVSA